MFLRLNVAVIAGLGLFVRAAWGAGFTPPADGKFTEPQLVQFLDAQKEWRVEEAKILEAMSSAKTPADKALASGGIDKQYRACLDKHFISKEEYEWLSRQAEEAWGVAAYLDGSYKSAHDQFEGELKEIDANIASDNQQLDAYKTALKNGWRVLSPDERDAIVKAATKEQQTAGDEAKRRGDDVAEVDEEAKQHDADAKRAEDAAADPPADLTGDDRADYIANKKEEAAAAKRSAGEARNQEADSKDAQAAAQTKADAAAKRVEHPEIPASADARDQARADDQAGIDDTTKMIAALKAQRDDVVKSEAGLDATKAKEVASAPAENVAIMRKYADRYKTQTEGASATTRKAE